MFLICLASSAIVVFKSGVFRALAMGDVNTAKSISPESAFFPVEPIGRTAASETPNFERALTVFLIVASICSRLIRDTVFVLIAFPPSLIRPLRNCRKLSIGHFPGG